MMEYPIAKFEQEKFVQYLLQLSSLIHRKCVPRPPVDAGNCIWGTKPYFSTIFSPTHIYL